MNLTIAELVGSLFGAYALGWAWAYIVLTFKRLVEVSS